MPTYRFRFDLGELGPIVPAELQAAVARSLGSEVIRVGVYGRVEGVRDGRPIGTQAIDVSTARASKDAVAAAVAQAMAALGLQSRPGEAEVREAPPAVIHGAGPE
jgi:hypothetical protein